MEKQQLTGNRRKMERTNDFFSDRGLCHYRLVIIPDAQIILQMAQEHAYAIAAFGNKCFPSCSRELMLARFQAKEEMEDVILRWLHRVVCQESEFRLQFNNYGSMPGYPLYVRVQDPKPFRQLANSFKIIDGLLEGNDCPAIRIASHPRLMLSSALDEQSEMEVLLDFSSRSFRAEMSVQEILLIKNQQDIVSRLRLAPVNLRRNEIINMND